VTIEQRDIFREDEEFGLPATLKRLMRDRGLDPEGRKIKVGTYEITEGLYGASPRVPLTVSAARAGAAGGGS
jgi:hypothetical protein